MNRKAIAVYLDNHVKFDIEFSWLWKTWKLWSLDEEWDLVVYYNPDAKQYIDKYEGVIAVEMTPIGMSAEYPFLNSHYFCKEPYSQILKKYDYLLKTDCDVFLTENLRGFVPSKFMVGQGGYYNQTETNKIDYIKSLSIKFGLTYKSMSLSGASFLGKTKEVIQATNNQSHLTEAILKNHVETEEFKNSGFHKGISSMIAGELVINHCFSNQNLTLYSLDSKCFNHIKIASDVIHIHAWHVYSKWSKLNYFRGEYNDWRVELADAFSNAANYCHFIATSSIEEILRLRELYKNGLLKIDYELHNCEYQSKKILYKFPTRQRPEKFKSTLDTYYRMMNGCNFEFVVTADSDDESMNSSEIAEYLSKKPRLGIFFGQSKTKIEAINNDVDRCKNWDILVLVSDDMIPQVHGFDDIIRKEMLKHYPDGDGVLWFYDGFRKNINTLCVIGRKYYERFGYIYHPSYITACCDNEFTEVANSLGKQTFINQVIIKHEHPVNVNEVVWDSLYQRNHEGLSEDHKNLVFRRDSGFPK